MKRLLLVLMLILGAVMITSRPVATYAYTDEEKQQAKSWLSSHGYPPTRAGAEQAYQDYMDGKIDVPEADAYMGKNQTNNSTTSAKESTTQGTTTTKVTTETKEQKQQKEEKKKKEQKETKKKHTTGIAIGAAAVVIFALLVVFMRKRM